MSFMQWLRRFRIQRVLSIVSLLVMTYLGVMRCFELVHADRCLDAGGSYDAAHDTCKMPEHSVR